MRSSPAEAPGKPGVELGQQPLAAELDREVPPLGPVERLAVDRAQRSRRPRRRPAPRGARPASGWPKPSRSRSSSASIASSGTSTSALPTSSPRHSPSSAFGRTPTSIVNSSSSPSAGRSPTSSFGSPTVTTPDVEQRPLVPLGQRVAQRLLDHRLAADALDHELRRHLALAEAGQLHLAGELLRGAVDLAARAPPARPRRRSSRATRAGL